MSEKKRIENIKKNQENQDLDHARIQKKDIIIKKMIKKERDLQINNEKRRILL